MLQEKFILKGVKCKNVYITNKMCKNNQTFILYIAEACT